MQIHCGEWDLIFLLFVKLSNCIPLKVMKRNILVPAPGSYGIARCVTHVNVQ